MCLVGRRKGDRKKEIEVGDERTKKASQKR